MSPILETGCSEVSTTVTLIDGSSGTCKDDSSTSTTTSPSIENPKQLNKILEDPLERNSKESEIVTNKKEMNIDVQEQRTSKYQEEVINIEASYDYKSERKNQTLKKYDCPGMYNIKCGSPGHSTPLARNACNNNNNRKTSNSKVRL